MMKDNKNISKLIIMRGLGYSQQEIADKLNISRKTVENHLRRLKFESEDDGLYNTYLKYLNLVDCVAERLREELY